MVTWLGSTPDHIISEKTPAASASLPSRAQRAMEAVHETVGSRDRAGLSKERPCLVAACVGFGGCGGWWSLVEAATAGKAGRLMLSSNYRFIEERGSVGSGVAHLALYNVIG